MKIAFIKKKFTAFGGAENYLATLIEKLKGGNHEIHVLASGWRESSDILFHRIETMNLNSLISTISFNQNAERAIKALRPDCTVSFERTTCQDIFRASDGCHREWLRLRRFIDGPAKRLSFHINPFHRTLLKMEKEIFRNTPIIIANSNMVKAEITKHYGVRGDRIRVLYNGVDLKRFSPANRLSRRVPLRKSRGIGLQTPVILFVGSGYERKGLGTLIAALPGMELNNAKLIVVGRGNTDKFRKIALRNGVEERVIFAGAQKDIEKFYAASDIFVLPTIYDPFSNVVLEALASGLPVITTRHNGASEIIDQGIDGFVLENALDSAELASRMDILLASPGTARKAARQKAENFPIEKSARELIDLITSFCNQEN